jgi:hypothetical protein
VKIAIQQSEPASEIHALNMQTRQHGELNEVQRRRPAVTCKYIDGLLCDIEHALHSQEFEPAFPHFAVDVTPAQARMIEDHIGRLRAQLLKALDWQHMKPEPPEIPVSRAVITNLGFVDIAVEELRPRYMRGSGAIPEDAIDGLNQVVDELRNLVHGIEHSIRHELEMKPGSHLSESEESSEEGQSCKSIS